jgi:hypothetical protein
LNATALLATLRERGASVRADGDRLKVKNDAALTDSDRAAIRHHKAAILELLELLARESASREEKVRLNSGVLSAPAPPVLSLVPRIAPAPDAYEGVTGAAMLKACLEAGRRYPKWTSAERHDFALALARLEAGAGADANEEKVRIAFARGHTSNGTALDYGAADELLGTEAIKKTEGGDQ